WASAGGECKAATVQPAFARNQRRLDEELYTSVEKIGALARYFVKDHPNLVVWPETAVGKIGIDKMVLAAIRYISDAVDAPIITGSSEVLKFAERSELEKSVQFNNLLYNSAYLIDSSGLRQSPYRKKRLVPFSEYIPEVPFFK
ncbi:MAG: hypothetical protein HKP44_04295, partial [Desulfofustis sp.]|nr:hypothetical protein [Desulfofustis sp.]